MSKKVLETLLLHHASIIIYTEGSTACLQPFWQEMHPLLWATVRATHGKITVSGIPNCLYYCKIIIVYTKYTNVALGCIIQLGGLQVGDQ
jgi:hypothetical protein